MSSLQKAGCGVRGVEDGEKTLVLGLKPSEKNVFRDTQCDEIQAPYFNPTFLSVGSYTLPPTPYTLLNDVSVLQEKLECAETFKSLGHKFEEILRNPEKTSAEWQK